MCRTTIFDNYFYISLAIGAAIAKDAMDVSAVYFLDEVNEDVSKTLKCFRKSDMGRREFRCVSVHPPVYVYEYNSCEQTANSSVQLSAWDEFADITSNEDETIQNEDLLQFDFMPFFVDNAELASIRTDDLLERVVSGAEIMACGKYAYERTHVGVGWDERVWSQRLYYCIKEKENALKNMGVTVFNLSDDGPNWSTRLPLLLRCHSFACNFTPFKGVTDLLLLGRKHAVLVLSSALTMDDIEHVSSQKIDSGVLVTEISVCKPKLVDCRRNGESLPSKMSELLSSMFLIGVMSCVEDILNLKAMKIYGWLIFRGTYSIGVQLDLDADKCHVNVLWTRANMVTTMSHHINYFVNLLNRE